MKTVNSEANVQLVNSTCPYCGVGCGVDVLIASPSADECGNLQVSGTPEHPSNFGRLCVKGKNLPDTNQLDGRLLTPHIHGNPVEWDEAVNKVAGDFNRIIKKYGPDAVAFYVSGQLLTEDYYVANKLMKGFIGSANIDTNSRLCMSSAVAAYQRAFGEDVVPCCYEDLEQTDLIILVGSNAAWTHPVLFQRIERAKQLNPLLKIVVIDPRATITAKAADLHLAIASDSDAALFSGLLHYIASNNGLNRCYINQFTEGFDSALASVKAWTIDNVAARCLIAKNQLEQFFEWFCSTDKVVSCFTMGVNQSEFGADKANAIINCHLATGKLGREGCGPFSLTGQPNAMGGREVGGMANMLAAHMDINNSEDQQRVQQFWQAPHQIKAPGPKAIEMFEKIRQGKIKALWVMATNPVVSLPNRDKITQALQQLELLVVSDCVASNDTIALCDVALPATGWSEKNGTVTNSERRISRQRSVLTPAGQAKHDWQIMCSVAKAMGFEQEFNYQHPADIFAEHCALTALDNKGKRALDLSGLTGLTVEQYDQMRPVQWPVNSDNPDGTKRMFVDGHFNTQTGKAQFVAINTDELADVVQQESYPFHLNSGRLRDQWHTMTRTGKAPSLLKHTALPFIAMHPETAQTLGYEQGQLLSIESKFNTRPVILPLITDDGLAKYDVFAPIHWSDQQSSAASIAALYGDVIDAVSGQPALKHCQVSVKKMDLKHHGVLLSRSQLAIDWLNAHADYWLMIKIEQGWVYQLASHSESFTLHNWLPDRCAVQKDAIQFEHIALSHLDKHTSCVLENGQLKYLLSADSQQLAINLDWFESLLKLTLIDHSTLAALLRGKQTQETDQIVCSCFKVTRTAITQAIQSGCDSVTALGTKLKCGTNCGSCKGELADILRQTSVTDSVQLACEDKTC